MLGLQDKGTYIKDMKKIKTMIESAPTKSMAMEMLDIHLIYGDISKKEYDKGRKLIVKEFKKFDLQNSVSYSDVNYQPVNQQEQKKKDKFYQDWFEKASKIQLTYKDSVFYSATWKNNGWYVQ